MPKLFADAFQAAAIGMSIVGLDGRFMRVNHALCQITGYSEAELLARTVRDITHPDDWETDRQYVERMIRGEIDTYQREKHYRRKDGSTIWVLLIVSLRPAAEDFTHCFFSQVQDITARKDAEARLAAAAVEKQRLYEELQRATAEVAKLQEGLVTICAWTKQIRYEGTWESVEEFLTKHLHLTLTHGISEQVAGRMLHDFEAKVPREPPSPS